VTEENKVLVSTSSPQYERYGKLKLRYENFPSHLTLKTSPSLTDGVANSHVLTYNLIR
jgi:hypothetical protein